MRVIKLNTLREMLRVAVSSSNGDLRNCLNTLNIKRIGDKLHLVATNGHHLTRSIVEDIAFMDGIPDGDDFTIFMESNDKRNLKNFLSPFKKLDGHSTTVEVSSDHVGLRFSFQTQVFLVREFTNEFIRYESCIPKNTKTSVGYNRKYLIAMLESQTDDHISLSFFNELSPCIIKSTSDVDGSFINVLMPVHLRDGGHDE